MRHLFRIPLLALDKDELIGLVQFEINAAVEARMRTTRADVFDLEPVIALVRCQHDFELVPSNAG